ncbi:MAG: HU family DNA-binding protein [bacterium]
MSVKKDLVREFAETGITQQTAREMAQFIIDQVFEKLSRGESVQITNFGTFELREHEGRTMENPNTGETHEIPDRPVVHFSPSKNFKERFN